MRKNLSYPEKTIDELISQNKILQENYAFLQRTHDLILTEIDQQNKLFSKLNQYSVELSNLPPDINLEVYVSKMIKEITGAKFTVFSEYNSDSSTLRVQHIELEAGLLEKVIGLIGKQVKKIDAYVSKEMYQMMCNEIIGIRETLYEVSFGSISKPIGAAVQKLLNVDRFIGIAYIIDDKLYGTSLLAMHKGTPNPSKQVLENILFLVAVTLRRRKAENLLKENQTKVSALLQAIPDMMFIQNKDGVYIDYHAPEGTKLYAQPEFFLGKKLEEVLPPEFSIEFKSVFENALQTKALQNYEYSLKMPDGIAFFECRTIAYEDNKILSLVRDITERKQSEIKIKEQNIELKKLNDDKNRFMSILAHDLKSPFNSILGFLDLVSENINSYELKKTEKFILLIRNSSKQLYQLLEGLLVWAKSQSGKMVPSPQIINFTYIGKQIVEEMKLRAEMKNIKIHLLSHENEKVFADVEMLKTILRNLITNAIKYTSEGGKIDIYTQNTDEQITIVVSDNGVGMSKEIVDTLLNLSSYHTTSGTNGETGSGLGLFLCKELIEKNNGKIWVESEPGVGSKFKFILPHLV